MIVERLATVMLLLSPGTTALSEPELAPAPVFTPTKSLLSATGMTSPSADVQIGVHCLLPSTAEPVIPVDPARESVAELAAHLRGLAAELADKGEPLLPETADVLEQDFWDLIG